MKNLLLLILSLTMATSTFAQQHGDSMSEEELMDRKKDNAAEMVSKAMTPDPVEFAYDIKAADIPFSIGLIQGYELTIQDANKDVLEEVWKNYVKEKGAKLKYDRKSKEYSATDFIVPGQSLVSTAYSFVAEESTMATLKMAFEVSGTKDFVSQENYPDCHAAILAMGADVAKNVKIEAINNELKEEEKILGDREKDLKNLKNDKDKLEKQIDNCKKDIKDAERDLETLARDKETLYKLMNPEAGEVAITPSTKQLKEWRKELKKIERKEESNHKTINKCTQTIQDNESELPVNEQMQIEASKAIDIQKEVVSKVQSRLQKAMVQ